MTKKLTTIWRVENTFGGGPYRRPEYGGILAELTKIGFNRAKDARRPDPCKDDGIADFSNSLSKDDKRSWVFGFKSLKQYQEWFNTKAVRDLLHRNGFFLTRYEIEADKIRHSEKQTVFIRRKGTVTEFRNCHGKPLDADEELAQKIADLAEKKELTLKPGAEMPRPRARRLCHNLRPAA